MKSLREAVLRYAELDSLIEQALEAARAGDRLEALRLSAGVLQKTITLDAILEDCLPELHDEDLLHPRHRLIRPGNEPRPPLRYSDEEDPLYDPARGLRR